MMETFLIQIPNDPHGHRVNAASWKVRDNVLSSYDDEGQLIDSWQSDEWVRIFDGMKPEDEMYRNPTQDIPFPRR